MALRAGNKKQIENRNQYERTVEKEDIYIAIRHELREQIETMRTADLVPRVCDALVRHNRMPGSWIEIREITGKGSSTTLTKALSLWRKSFIRPGVSATIPGLPDDPQILDAAQQFFKRFAQHIGNSAAEKWQGERQDLEARLQTCRTAITELTANLATATQDLGSANSKLRLVKLELTGTQRELAAKKALLERAETQAQQAINETNTAKIENQSLLQALKQNDQAIESLRQQVNKLRADNRAIAKARNRYKAIAESHVQTHEPKEPSGQDG